MERALPATGPPHSGLPLGLRAGTTCSPCGTPNPEAQGALTAPPWGCEQGWRLTPSTSGVRDHQGTGRPVLGPQSPQQWTWRPQTVKIIGPHTPAGSHSGGLEVGRVPAMLTPHVLWAGGSQAQPTVRAGGPAPTPEGRSPQAQHQESGESR